MFDPWANASPARWGTVPSFGWGGFRHPPLSPMYGWPSLIFYVGFLSMISITVIGDITLPILFHPFLIGILGLALVGWWRNHSLSPGRPLQMYLANGQPHLIYSSCHSEVESQFSKLRVILSLSSSLSVLPIHDSIRSVGFIVTVGLIPLAISALMSSEVPSRLTTSYLRRPYSEGYTRYNLLRWLARTLDITICLAVSFCIERMVFSDLALTSWDLYYQTIIANWAVSVSILFLVFLGYEVITVAFWGSTLGKRICRLRIVDVRTGMAPRWSSACLRGTTLVSVPLLLVVIGIVTQFDVLSLSFTTSMIALMLSGLLHPHEQGLHDIGARTVVSQSDYGPAMDRAPALL